MTATANVVQPRVQAADLYERLGAARSDGLAEIRRAYHALVRRYSPEQAPEEFKRIREAYEVLSDPIKRKQYDSRPDPTLTELGSRAQQASEKGDFASAERLYKQILVLAPDRHDVRELLGHSLLRQGQAQAAIAQLERVRDSGAAQPRCFGWLGRAYRNVKRYSDAERAYRAGLAREGHVDVPHICASLADLLIDRGDLVGACELLDTQTAQVPFTSDVAFQLLALRLNVAVRQNDDWSIERQYASVTARVVNGGSSPYAAGRLGDLARTLIDSEYLVAAQRAARAAAALQPRDPDYDALERLAVALQRNDIDAAERLLWTHVSFSPRQWLSPFRQWVEQYCEACAVFRGLPPVVVAPGHRMFAGCGFKLRGRDDVNGPSKSYVATQYLHLFGIPVITMRSYRVRDLTNGRQRCVAVVPLPKRVVQLRARIFWLGFLALMGGCWAWGAVSR